MAVLIYDWDMTKFVLAKYKPDYIKIAPQKIKLEVDDKDIIKVMKEDPLIHAQMVEAATEAVQKLMPEVVRMVKDFDLEVTDTYWEKGDKSVFSIATLKFKGEYEKKVDEVTEKAQIAMKKAWKDYTAKHKEYLKYKIKIIAKVGVCLVSAGAGVAVAASAAVGNIPGLIAGCVGAAKALSTAFQAVKVAGKSAYDVYNELGQDLKELVADYAKMSKAAVTATEVGKKLLEALTTKGLNSIKECESKLGTFKSKLLGVDQEAHEAAKALNKLLGAMDDIADEIKDSKLESLKKVKEQELAKAEKDVQPLIERVPAILKLVKEGKKGAEGYGQTLKDLKDQMSTGTYKAAAFAIDASVLALDLWGGFGAAGDSAEKFMEKAEDIAEAAASSVLFVVDVIKDCVKDATK